MLYFSVDVVLFLVHALDVASDNDDGSEFQQLANGSNTCTLPTVLCSYLMILALDDDQPEDQEALTGRQNKHPRRMCMFIFSSTTALNIAVSSSGHATSAEDDIQPGYGMCSALLSFRV